LQVIIEHILRSSPYERLVILAELCIIGLVVYAVLNFLEGTRGERLFRGMVLVLFFGSLVLNLGVKTFGMDRIAFLYSGFLLAVLIVAVIAFQPEIRRALIRIGQTSFFKAGAHHQISRGVEEIVSAVCQLAATRTGALLVIERHVGLGEFIETGVRLDARITAELIKTIFYPGTPLHDMALVIRGDRLLAARVQLPLSEGESALGSLGSRHRAALGMASGSDALVIVVSEESGIISIASDGKLERNVTESQLRKVLKEAMEGREPSSEEHPDVG
jgi:diadenylate cyclase